MPSRCSNTLVILVVRANSVLHLVSRIIFVCCWLNYTENTLRLRAKRLDDGAEVVVGMSSFRSHVLGIDCGGQRKCLRRLVEKARATQTRYRRHVAAVTPEIGRVRGAGESVSLSRERMRCCRRGFCGQHAVLLRIIPSLVHTHGNGSVQSLEIPPKPEMRITFCYPSSSS